MDALDDDLLVRIFAQLTDGLVLLDVLPLVCKRWCRLARTAASWAGVRLSLWNKVDAARVLLHAPALASLWVETEEGRRKGVLERMDGALYELTNKLLRLTAELCRRRRSALRRSRALVRDTVYFSGTVNWQPQGPRDVAAQACLAAFFSRQRQLRELKFYLWPGDVSTTLSSLAALHGLEKLDLVTDGNCYGGEFATGLPKLRELHLRARRASKPVSGMLGDLVRGAPELRFLQTDFPTAPADRDACVAMRGLRRLELCLYIKEATDGVMRDVRDAYRGVAALCRKLDTADLRTLTILLDCGKRNGLVDPAGCFSLAQDLAAKLPSHVKVAVSVEHGPLSRPASQRGSDESASESEYETADSEVEPASCAAQ